MVKNNNLLSFYCLSLHKSAFTLAEVLITLGIIGVIAAITIPALLNTTDEKDIVVGTKKAYSLFSNAFNSAENENGPVASWGCTDNACYFNKLTPYLKITQNCGTAAGQGCFPKSVVYNKISGPAQFDADNNTTYPKAKLNDGMSFTTEFRNASCSGTYTANTDNLALNHVCAAVYVDVNGNNGPNVCGKDFFPFWITSQGIVPSGTEDDTSYPLDTECSNKSGRGYGCTAWVIYKENMDYLKGIISW